MPEDKEPKQAKSKGRTRPSFSAPVYATESRAAGWVDIPVPPSTDPLVEPESAVTAPPAPLVSVATRRPRVLPKPRAAHRPETPDHAETPKHAATAPTTTLATIEEPIEVEYDRPTLAAARGTGAPLATTPSASVSGVIVAGVSVAVGMAILSTYVAFEMFAFPLRLAAGILAPRKQS